MLVLLLALAAWFGPAGAVGASPKPGRNPPTEPPRNPAWLRASKVLGADPTAALRVRFEWPQVPRAVGYSLVGAITDRRSWTVRSATRRVDRGNAAAWDRRHVVYETPLEAGIYAWKVVALFPPNDRGDFTTPATVAFELE